METYDFNKYKATLLENRKKKKEEKAQRKVDYYNRYTKNDTHIVIFSVSDKGLIRKLKNRECKDIFKWVSYQEYINGKLDMYYERWGAFIKKEDSTWWERLIFKMRLRNIGKTKVRHKTYYND